MIKPIPFFKLFWPFGIGMVLLLFPLLRDLHLESALLVSTIFCFLSGLKASKWTHASELKIITRSIIHVISIALPLLIFGFFTECLTWSGIGFWLLLPFPSILFGVAIGRFFKRTNVPFPRSFTFVSLLIVGLGILIVELYTLPQVYFFNHVWGTWPGPIYDQEVSITSGLLWFRLSTLLWVLLIWLLPSISTSKIKLGIVICCGMVLATSFFIHPQLGISSPRNHLKSELSTLIETDHFHLYFDSTNFDDQERAYWAARHEFHFNQIIDILEIDWPKDRYIESYIYENAWRKKELVGAKFTSYVPVWLDQDQMHIAKEHLDQVLKHELVHVLTKQFGNTLFNASWSIGLIEGVAEAIAKDASSFSTLDQIIAAEQPLPSIQKMKSALSAVGFYSSASAISYTTVGSFVGYLLNHYPIENFKKAYPTSNIEEAYALPFDTLVTRWKAQLKLSETDSTDAVMSRRVFSQQSLFQIQCPRTSNPILEGLDDIRYYESLSDTANVLSAINQLYVDYPDISLIKNLWAKYQLIDGNFDAVISEFSELDSTLSQQFLYIDAYFSSNEYDAAQRILHLLKKDSTYAANPNAKHSFSVRSDSVAWDIFIQAKYENELVDVPTFVGLPIPLQWLLVYQAINKKNKNLVNAYAGIMLEKPIDIQWFDTQEHLIDILIYFGSYDVAQSWIDALLKLELRERFKERLQEQQEWLHFYNTSQNKR